MNVAVMGYGTVGSGVVEIIDNKHAEIQAKHCKEDLKVTHILDLRDFPGDPHETILTKNFEDILSDDSVGIVVEAMGGVTPAFDFTAKLLSAGKHVVTSNKELVATKGLELLALAKEHNVNYLFEASVGGGIPILRPLSVCLAANGIESINGILNGTTNFILSKMIFEHMAFADVLKIAQEKGYAEADPTADVEGIDACRKISILASLGFGSYVNPKDIQTEGITKITLEDVAYANSADCVIKLIGTAEKLENGQLNVLVSPALVRKTSMIAGVNDVFNAVAVKGDAVGDTLFYGPGAGKLPTASACVADVIDCANHQDERRLVGWGPEQEGLVADAKTIPNKYYVRLAVEDSAAAEAATKDAFGTLSVLHREGGEKELAFLTPSLSENEVRAKLDTLSSARLIALIRVANC